MTKIIAFFAFLMAAVLALTTLFGCGGTTDPTPTNPINTVEDGGDISPVGGWTVAEFGAANLPDDAAEALEKATAALDGASYTPITLLATQVVAGVNYAILCAQTTATATPVTTLKVVIVYAGFDGSAEIRNIADFDIGTYNTGNVDWAVNSEQLSGGWTTAEEVVTFMDSEANDAFAAATSDLVGYRAVPTAVLGTQVVAGSNTAYLARVTDRDGNTAFKIVIVYNDLSGNHTVTAAESLNIGDFNR